MSVGQSRFFLSLPVESPRIGGHQLHGTGQHRASGGQERRTDPTVETSVRLVTRPSCAPSCSCPLNAGTTRRRRYVPPLGGGATAHGAASTLHYAGAAQGVYGSRRGSAAMARWLRGSAATARCAAARRRFAARQRCELAMVRGAAARRDPGPGFPYCGTTVMVVPRAGTGQVRHGRGPAA